MTLRTRIRLAWSAAIFGAAFLSAACDQQEPATPEGLCKRAASCEPMDLLVSSDSCAQQVRHQLIDATPACSECVLGLPCSGMARVATGKVSLSQICPACPPALTSHADCAAPHVLICGMAAAPSPSGSASAPPPSAPPPASAPPTVLPSKPAPPPLTPLPTEPRLPTVPVPPLPR